MHFLLNILFGVLGGFLASYIARRCHVSDPAAVIIGLTVGVIIFICNFAAQVL